MSELIWRDVLAHRTVWIGAALVAAVTSMFTTVCLGALITAATTAPDAFAVPEGPEVLLKSAGNLLFLSGVPAIVVLAVVLGTLVTQTGSVHARWRLAGASPAQVLRMFSAQVVVVCVLGAAVGAVAALPVMGPATSLLGRGTADGVGAAGPLHLLAVVGAVLVVAGCGAVAGLLPAVRASRASPIAQATARATGGRSVLRLVVAIGFVLCVQLPLLLVLLPMDRLDPSLEAPGVAVTLAMLMPAGLAMVIVLALFAPFYLSGVLRAWTALPGLRRWTAWALARHMAVTRSAQTAAAITPLMVGVGLFTCFHLMATAARNAGGAEGTSLNLFDGALMLTPIGVIGAVGSAAVVLMSSRHRAQDVTGLRTAGASPARSLAVFACEAVIDVVTALLLAAVAGLGQSALFALALLRWGLPLDLSGLELPGALLVAVLGGGATLAIIIGGGALAWRQPLITAAADR